MPQGASAFSSTHPRCRRAGTKGGAAGAARGRGRRRRRAQGVHAVRQAERHVDSLPGGRLADVAHGEREWACRCGRSGRTASKRRRAGDGEPALTACHNPSPLPCALSVRRSAASAGKMCLAAWSTATQRTLTTDMVGSGETCTSPSSSSCWASPVSPHTHHSTPPRSSIHPPITRHAPLFH